MTQIGKLEFLRVRNPSNPDQKRELVYSVKLNGEQIALLIPVRESFHGEVYATPRDYTVREVWSYHITRKYNRGLNLCFKLPLNLTKTVVRDILLNNGAHEIFSIGVFQNNPVEPHYAYHQEALQSHEREKLMTRKERQTRRKRVSFRLEHGIIVGKMFGIYLDDYKVAEAFTESPTGTRHSLYRFNMDSSAYFRSREIYQPSMPFQKQKALCKHLVTHNIQCKNLKARDFRNLAEFARQKELLAGKTKTLRN